MNKFIPQIDWRATYRRFAEVHGGNPLEWRGWLLFPDGWRWSASSHQGPELPPENDDQAKELASVYWRMRLASVLKELRELRVALVGLEQSARVWSAPLQQRIMREVASRDERGNDVTRRVPAACDLDLDGLRGRIAWLEEDAEQCGQRIEEQHAPVLAQE